MRDRIGELVTRRCILHPVFVVGAGRSGTSILLKALGLHPLILPTWGEASLIGLFAAFGEALEFSDSKDYHAKNLNVPKDYLYQHLRRLCFEYVMGPHYGLGDTTVRALIRDSISIRQKRHWCAKTFPQVSEYGGLLQLYPGVKFIYIIRNGINVVHSRTEYHGFRHLDFETQCQAWAEAIDIFHFLVTAEAALEVRHERLVADPEGFFHDVFGFVGVDYHEEPVSFVRNNMVVQMDGRSKAGVEVRQVFESRKPPYESWTPEQRAAFKDVAGDAMRKVGYEIPF